ncbi:MAG: hypothetical protein IJ662_03280 [Clostridia bacterium]|nr:hypothetical protein [Clostridia bacterium]
MAAPKPLEFGFSPEGFIIDQDCFSEFQYRTIPANLNGCGWIAAYNLRRALDHSVTFDEVRQELDDLHFLKIPGPTLMCVMRKYLKQYVPEYQETVGRAEALTAAKESRAGIFRYREGHEPHFTSYIRQGDGLFRFFNMADDFEDCVMPMEQFIRDHCAPGTVILLWVKDQAHE